MTNSKDLSNCTKAVRAEAKKLAQQSASRDIVSEEEYDFLLKESAKVLSNPELDIIMLEIKDSDYKIKIGGVEAGSTQNVSTAIRSKLTKEIRKSRQYIKAIEETVALETELENRNHRRSLFYRIINTFAIYGTIIVTSMIAHYGFGVNLALVSFKSSSEIVDCQKVQLSKEQMVSVLKALEDEDIAMYVEKKLIKNCTILNK